MRPGTRAYSPIRCGLYARSPESRNISSRARRAARPARARRLARGGAGGAGGEGGARRLRLEPAEFARIAERRGAAERGRGDECGEHVGVGVGRRRHHRRARARESSAISEHVLRLLVSLLGAAAAASLSTSVSTALNTASARAPESQIRSNAGAGATWARVLRFGGVRARLTCNYDLRASAALLKERRLRGYFPADASLSGALRTAAKNGRVVRYQLRHSPLSGASAVDLKTTAAGATLRAGLAAGDGLQELGVERGVGSHCFVAAAVHAKTRAAGCASPRASATAATPCASWRSTSACARWRATRSCTTA